MTQRKNQDLDDQSQLMRNEMVSDAFRQASRIVRQLDRDGAFDFIFITKKELFKSPFLQIPKVYFYFKSLLSKRIVTGPSFKTSIFITFEHTPLGL